MCDYEKLVEKYSNEGNKNFSVIAFEGKTEHNEHQFIVSVRGLQFFLGCPEPRGFIGIADNQIQNHVSRRDNWNSLATSGQLFWLPIQGPEQPGRFVVGGGNWDDGVFGEMGMSGPGHQPPQPPRPRRPRGSDGPVME